MARKVNHPFRVIRTIDGVVRHLGGRKVVAEMFGIEETTICNWPTRGGIPPEYYDAMMRKLAENNRTAPPSLWQMREAAAE